MPLMLWSVDRSVCAAARTRAAAEFQRNLLTHFDIMCSNGPRPPGTGWHDVDGIAAGSQNSGAFSMQLSGIFHMFQQIRRENHVEAVVRKRELPAVVFDDRIDLIVAVVRGREIDRADLVTFVRQQLGLVPGPATDLENTAPRRRREMRQYRLELVTADYV